MTILGAPAVSFELPADRCSGQPTVFDADFGPEVIRLSWDFGDPGSGAADTGRGAQAFHQYTVPGTYTVSVQAIGRYGCDSTFTRDITIVANTLAGANGAFGNTMATSQAGDYFVTAVNEFGCEAQSNQMRILSGPNTSLVPNGCYNRCLPDTLCLPDIPGVATYQWIMDGMPLGTPSSSPPELIVTEDGAYRLDMVGTNGCTAASDPLNLTLFEENGTFTGLVYIDLNNNGVIDPSDSLYNGALITLLQEGSIVNDALTQADSSYAFPELPSGDYLLLLDSLSLPDGLSPLYTQVDTSIAGCGSTFRVDWLLTITCQPDSTFIELSGCDSVAFRGETYLQDTLLSFISPGIQGCDTTELVNIRVLSTSDSTLLLGACEGATVSYEGVALMPGQQQQFTFENAAGCDSIVTVNVQALPELAVEVMADTADCEQLNSNVRAIVRSGDNGNLSLIWSNGDTGPNTTFPAPGQGELTVSNDCETMVLPFDLPVEGQAKDQLIYLPNAFSPNGDGRNDVFQAYLAQGTDWLSFRLAVFDRWGNQLFETARPQAGWDGTFRGERMSTGVYIFHLTGEVDGCGQAFLVELRGDVTLVR